MKIVKISKEVRIIIIIIIIIIAKRELVKGCTYL